jgi:hypothetical protein
VDADWERRRSRSPVERRKLDIDGRMIDEGQGAGVADLGSALLSGTLQAADGAPPPPPHHPDPILDFYKDTCVGDIWTAFSQPMDYDPMIGEALAACTEVVSRPLSFSPPGSPLAEELRSPAYTHNAVNCDKLAELNEEATALGLNHVIHFGPGVQQEVDGCLVTTGITEQVAELILEERLNKIVDSIFVPCEQPVLETPVMQKQQTKTKPGKVTVSGLRRSTRQKANVSSVPVSKRATQRLAKAFQTRNAELTEPTGDEALQAFIKAFSQPLSKVQIDVVRRLTSLDGVAAMEAAAQLVAAEGAESMGADGA